MNDQDRLLDGILSSHMPGKEVQDRVLRAVLGREEASELSVCLLSGRIFENAFVLFSELFNTIQC